MTEINRYLFVYGTLLQKDNKFAAYLNESSTFYGKAKVSGKLYHIGEYPGLVLQPDGEQFAYGNIYIMADPETTLKILDEYEGFGEGYAQPNEFIRVLTAIETSGKLLTCWVYLYNLPVGGFKHIISGDYFADKALDD